MILAFATIAILLSITYTGIIFIYRYWWNKLPLFELLSNFSPHTYISIIIPARNEAVNVLKCLDSLKKLNYPKHLFEILLINDHSTDGTNELATAAKLDNLSIINLPPDKRGKKMALSEGISKAKGQLILTTDADCRVPVDWLNYFAGCYEAGNTQFIAGPVVFENEKNIFEKFQSLDFMGMMLVTGAGISGGFMHSCNGANLAYPKEVFLELGGFQDIDHLASGDDILFMQKVIQKYPDQVVFLKNPEASVQTEAISSLNSFLQQRIRWGTKSTQYHEWKITAILSLVFFFCWSIILSFLLIPFYGRPMLFIFLGQLLIKSLVDYYFLRQASHFFRREDLMKSYGISQALHIIYIAVAGFLANMIKKYQWKGRTVK